MSGPRTLAVARKEVLQLRRDPRSLILAFVLPVFMIVFFGYAITWDIDEIPLAVVDGDGTAASRELVEAFRGSRYFALADGVPSPREGVRRLVRGKVLGLLVVPRGFARDLAAGRRPPVQLLLDGSDANTATIALNYAEALVARYGLRRRSPPASAPSLPAGGGPVLQSRIWYNETLESRNMIVPGLVAVIMSIIAAMLTSLTIAREWERGTMEQLAATPVGRLEVVAGKLLPYLAIDLADVALAGGVGVGLFGVPFRGSLLLLALLTLLFLLGALGLGIFISAVARSQVLAMQVAMVVTYLPAVLLSGFLFDIASMPPVLRAVTYLVPARYYVVVTRGIFLKGVGAPELWVQGLLMLLFAAVGLGLATRAFRKEIGP